MMEGASSIRQIEKRISARLRLLAVQDLIALSGLAAAAVAALAFLLFRSGLLDARIAAGIGMRGRLLLICIPVTGAAALLVISRILGKRGRWRSNLGTRPDQSDLILDRALHLEDRTSTAGAIIRRGGPAGVMETALVEDAASRLAGASPERIVAYRPPRLGSAVRCYTSVGCSIVSAMVVLIAIIQYLVPAYGAQEMDGGTIAVMQEAGDQLEQSSKAVEQSVNQDTPTAALAKQQAELARALKEGAAPGGRGRGKPLGRSQALKELSVLAEKMGDRKNELENTRASEIISLAERRFRSQGSGVRGQGPAVRGQGSAVRGQGSAVSGQRSGAGELEHVETRPRGKNQSLSNAQSPDEQTPDDRRLAASKPTPRTESSGKDAPSSPDNQVAGGVSQTGNKPSTEPKQGDGSIEPKPEDQTVESTAAGRAGTDQSSRDDAKAGDKQPEGMTAALRDGALSGLPDAAKSALPDLSGDLLKKAAEMRANNLTAADIEQFRKAAEGLLKDLSAKDLANLANSKAIQQTLEQLARQVNPEQIEQLARQLLSQKEIRDELQAVRKLIMENRQAKETIAGFADKAREIGEELQKQGFKPGVPPDSLSTLFDQSARGRTGAGAEPASRSGEGTKRYGRAGQSSEALKGKGGSGDSSGRAARAGNQINWKPEGEPIYGRPRPGTAPARVPYSAAYPGYRREAERSVQRSQVPPRMRALIRNYFDAINPDVEKRP